MVVEGDNFTVATDELAVEEDSGEGFVVVLALDGVDELISMVDGVAAQELNFMNSDLEGVEKVLALGAEGTVFLGEDDDLVRFNNLFEFVSHFVCFFLKVLVFCKTERETLFE